jgi:hypothetical protein
MRIDIFCDKKDFGTSKESRVIRNKLNQLEKILDHAVIDKKDICYTEIKNEMNILLLRHGKDSRARKKFLFLTVWNREIAPKQKCRLIIKDIDNYTIRDNDPAVVQTQKVIIGFSANESGDLYIGAQCDVGSDYGIDISVKRINILCEDIL